MLLFCSASQVHQSKLSQQLINIEPKATLQETRLHLFPLMLFSKVTCCVFELHDHCETCKLISSASCLSIVKVFRARRR